MGPKSALKKKKKKKKSKSPEHSKRTKPNEREYSTEASYLIEDNAVQHAGGAGRQSIHKFIGIFTR